MRLPVSIHWSASWCDHAVGDRRPELHAASGRRSRAGLAGARLRRDGESISRTPGDSSHWQAIISRIQGGPNITERHTPGNSDWE